MISKIDSQNTLKDAKKIKELAKELISGEEVQMTCFLLSSEGNLGRSSVIDLDAPHGKNFRQIDHRTLESLIINNKKYLLK